MFFAASAVDMDDESLRQALVGMGLDPDGRAASIGTPCPERRTSPCSARP